MNKLFGTQRVRRESNSNLNYPTQALYLFFDALVACIVQFTVFTVFWRIFLNLKLHQPTTGKKGFVWYRGWESTSRVPNNLFLIFQ